MFGRKALLFLMQRLVSALAMAAMLRFQFLDVGLLRGEQVGPQQGDDYHACKQQCAKAERVVPHAEQRHKPHAYHTENVHGEVDERAGASGIAVVLRKQDVGGIQAYQLHNLQHVALQNGWTTFTSMQCRYNLLYREDEREMIPVCRQFDMALTPYSPLASGHLCRPTWDSESKRSTTDTTMRNKYDRDREIDMPVIERVAKVAVDHHAPMAQVALAWHWARGVESLIVGCSKPERVDDAIAALDVKLTAEEVNFMEQPYVAHGLVGPKSRPGEKPLAGTTNVKLKQ